MVLISAKEVHLVSPHHFLGCIFELVNQIMHLLSLFCNFLLFQLSLHLFISLIRFFLRQYLTRSWTGRFKFGLLHFNFNYH